MREACAEAEAGDEAIEAVGIEKVGAYRELLLEVLPLFLGERSVQFGLKIALFLHQLFHAAVRTDGTVAGREISVVKVFQYVRHEVSSCYFLWSMEEKCAQVP